MAHGAGIADREAATAARQAFPPEPQENILYFVEKFSPKLEPWQRELVRIVRKLAQYFYPQAQTKVMNEGWATFWHYTILNRLHEKGQVDDGFMLEFLKSHTNVVAQPAFDSKCLQRAQSVRARLRDVPRPAAHLRAPDAEDREWFPTSPAATGRRTLDFAMRNFKDESFIAQYLSPRLIREFHLFAIADHAAEDDARTSTASTTSAAIAACASSSRSSMRRRSAFPTCRSCATIATATGR